MNRIITVVLFICVFFIASCASVPKQVEQSSSPTPAHTEKAVTSPGVADPLLYYNYLMAQYFRSEGYIEEAIKHYKIATTLDPDSLMLRFDLTTLLVEAARYDEAKQECVEIIKKDPRNLDAHLLLAAI
jgi:tetratricopeptide (TPR) repeat protein